VERERKFAVTYYRNIPRWVELASDWSEEDIAHLREQRKYWARKEQTVFDKKERKICQRYVKAITCCIKYVEGQPTDFPNELQSHMRAALNFSHQHPRIDFETM
jgi:hypothetical protein